MTFKDTQRAVNRAQCRSFVCNFDDENEPDDDEFDDDDEDPDDDEWADDNDDDEDIVLHVQTSARLGSAHGSVTLGVIIRVLFIVIALLLFSVAADGHHYQQPITSVAYTVLGLLFLLGAGIDITR